MRKLITSAVLSICCLVFLMGSAVRAEEYGAVFTESVSSITPQEIYIKGIKYFLTPDVKVYVKDENRAPVSMKSLANVGKIDKARIYMKGSYIAKIIILEMRQ